MRGSEFYIYILNLNTNLHAWFYYVPNFINAEKYNKNSLKRLFFFSYIKGLRRRRRGLRSTGLRKEKSGTMDAMSSVFFMWKIKSEGFEIL